MGKNKKRLRLNYARFICNLKWGEVYFENNINKPIKPRLLAREIDDILFISVSNVIL